MKKTYPIETFLSLLSLSFLLAACGAQTSHQGKPMAVHPDIASNTDGEVEIVWTISKGNENLCHPMFPLFRPAYCTKKARVTQSVPLGETVRQLVSKSTAEIKEQSDFATKGPWQASAYVLYSRPFQFPEIVDTVPFILQ